MLSRFLRAFQNSKLGIITLPEAVLFVIHALHHCAVSSSLIAPRIGPCWIISLAFVLVEDMVILLRGLYTTHHINDCAAR